MTATPASGTNLGVYPAPIRSTPLTYAAVPARLLLCAIFLLSGPTKLAGLSRMVGYAVAKGLPAPKAMLVIAGIAEILGGLSLLLGLWSRLGALGLFIYLIPTTLIFHDFWAITDPAAHQEQFINFMKNLAIMGGLLMVVAFGPGPLSIDSARRKIT